MQILHSIVINDIIHEDDFGMFVVFVEGFKFIGSMLDIDGQTTKNIQNGKP